MKKLDCPVIDVSSKAVEESASIILGYLKIWVINFLMVDR